MQEAMHYCDILKAYAHYATHCFQIFNKLEDDFYRIPKLQQSLVPMFDKKMKAIRACVGANQTFIRNILDQRAAFMNSDRINYDWVYRQNRRIKPGDMDKVKSTLKQCVRDWSAEGKDERKQCYGPILQELEKLFPNPSTKTKVLVPGSGLARLVWEVASMGFHAQGNEFSYFMLLCSYTILNCTKKPNVHRIFPFVHITRNIHSPKHQLASVRFPDVNPVNLPKDSLSMVAGDFQEIYQDQVEEWDCVASCFFLDTANNVIEYVRLISSLLKIGGYWINFGPLLYHYSGMYDEISIELSWEEIKPCLKHYNLELIREEIRKPATYCMDPNSMMKTEYRCLSFTCRKTAKTPKESPNPRYRRSKPGDPVNPGNTGSAPATGGQQNSNKSGPSRSGSSTHGKRKNGQDGRGPGKLANS
uniref:carnosine N-methyltransferase n=1 Tax=Amorphochlora amoebiformis TaxID=1561963 RepID=A0A7S0DFR0_9EUKA